MSSQDEVLVKGNASRGGVGEVASEGTERDPKRISARLSRLPPPSLAVAVTDEPRPS